MTTKIIAVLLLVIFIGCNANKAKDNAMIGVHWYKDFEFSTSKGIGEIDEKKALALEKKIRILYKNDSQIDSIYCFGKGNVDCIITLEQMLNVKTYSIATRDVLFPNGFEKIIMGLDLDKKTAIFYNFLSPIKTPYETTEIILTKISSDSLENFNCFINVNDTVGLIKKILDRQKIEVKDISDRKLTNKGEDIKNMTVFSTTLAQVCSQR